MDLATPLCSESEIELTYPRDKTVHQIFEEIALAFPNRTAATYEDQILTYGELNNRANDLAAKLLRLGVTTDDMVGCCCERSLELIVALLGILKAGGAYVPLDPAYPAERIDYMLNDTRPRAIIVTAESGANLVSHVSLPQLVEININQEITPPASLPTLGDAKSTAYVMYTSGSTGAPKGVLTEHRAIIRLVRDTNYCRFGPDESWLHYAPLSFDASTLEIWGALLNGGKVVLAPSKASLEDLGQLIREKSVSSVWLTTGLFNLMVENQLHNLTSVRQFFTGGDVVSSSHLRKARQALPQTVLINGYGPTENTTFTCCHVMAPGSPIEEPVPIGKPISHTTVYILNDQGQPVRQGETGEIFTGGDGVARGYLNKPDATAERFLDDPFAGNHGARMYKTGDLGRMRPDGAINFVGRVDNQVKLLGHRIEPGEIESVLSDHPAIDVACVIVHSDEAGSKRLIGYFKSSDESIGPKKIRDYLAAKLPRHMIPSLIVPMCNMPLTANGKLDRAALPKPAIATTFPLAPRTTSRSIEKMIHDTWCQLLNIKAIGHTDNFFDVGGDSLKLVAAHAQLERILQREIPILDMFEFNTIRSLASHLENNVAPTENPKAEQHRGQRQRAAFAARKTGRARN